ncbi:MAG: efflux RND transporter permease subunit [Bacteroidetes bacterium]|nr:efflux RND transporter permease subunit [Bacteroidota bacterium]
MEKDPSKRVKREFGLSSFAVDNRTSVFVLAIMIMILGVVTYSTMPRESFPEISQPEIYIGTIYPGNSPVDIENLITRPIEKELKALTGVDKMTSTSIQDYSTIIVSFNFDVPVSEALQDVKDAVDKAMAELPSDLDNDPDIFELDFSDMPIMNVNLYGDQSMEELRSYAEYLQDKIEDLSQIKEVDIRGVLEQEINILVDIKKMESSLISFRDIEDAIFQENVTMSGGDILTDGFRRNLRVVGEFKSIEELENIVVKRDRGNFVLLKDIAEVEFGYEDRQSFARLDGNEVVTLDIKKQSGENIIQASNAINDIVDAAMAHKFPKDLTVSITGDQSTQIKKMVLDLENNIISGVILVVIVLLFFLGLRNALFVGIAIPLSMVMGILWLSTSGVTLNMMVLFSLILALGMLVDNGIVVVENIYRLHSEGMPLKQAAKEGVGEVAWPIIASTATTLAAFLPLLFWKSLMGEFMKFLPLTLILVLSSSLFVGLVINPVLTSVFMKVEEDKKSIFNKRFLISMAILLLLGVIFYLLAYYEVGANATFKALGSTMVLIIVMVLLNKFILAPASHWFRTWFMPRLEKKYHGSLIYVLSGWKPLVVFGLTFLLLFGSIGYYFMNDPEIINMPGQEPQYINIFIEMPQGTDIEETNRLTMQVEEVVEEVVEPYRGIIDAVLAQVGEGTSDPMAGVSIGASPHKGRVNISFLEFDKRGGVLTSQIMDELRVAVNRIPGAKYVLGMHPVGPPVGKAVNIEVSGENYEDLIVLANTISDDLTKMGVEGVEGLELDLESGKPELLIDINRDAARRYGMSTIQIAAELRTSLFGKEVSKFKMGEEDYPIILRSDDQSRHSLAALLNKKVTFQNMDTGMWLSVPISSVANVEYTSSFGSVKRKDLDRVITIASNVVDGFNPTEVNNIYKDAVAAMEIPEGYQVSFTGEQEEQAETLNFLMTALMIAIFLIGLILVSQFNSLVSPAIVLFSVLFSTIGVFLGLAIFDMPFVAMMTGIGIISLAGIVVNNAIVLIDYTNLIRERRRAELELNESDRLPWEDVVYSIVKGGETRLRPVLLTAITTILGLIPLAVGLNIDYGSLLSEFDPKFYIGGDNVAFWGPMSWTVVFGLVFATFLTLFVVPVMYLLSDRFKDIALGIKRKRQERRRRLSPPVS